MQCKYIKKIICTVLRLCDDDVVNKLLSYVTLLVVMIEKWLTAVSCMQTTQVELQCYVYYPLLLALSVPVMWSVSNFMTAFVSPSLQSLADLAVARGLLEFNLNAPNASRICKSFMK